MAGIKHGKVGQANHCLGSDGRPQLVVLASFLRLALHYISIWNRSSLLKAFLGGRFARDVDFEFTIGDDKVFIRRWILVDVIYPDLSRFVKTLQELVRRRPSRYAV